MNQFHDVIPGTAIELANNDATLYYIEALQAANEVYDECFTKLFGEFISFSPNCNGWYFLSSLLHLVTS